MKDFIKRLFCTHVYKGIDRDILYWTREKDGGAGWGDLPTYSNFVYSALTEKCLKCNKILVITHRQNIGHAFPENVMKK